DLRALAQSRNVDDMPRIDFAICPVLAAVIRVLIGLVRAGSVTRLGSAGIVADAPRERVIRRNGDALRGALLVGHQHAVVVLGTAIDDDAKFADLIDVLRPQQTQAAANLSVRQRRARRSRCNLKWSDPPVIGAVSVRITVAGDVNR